MFIVDFTKKINDIVETNQLNNSLLPKTEIIKDKYEEYKDMKEYLIMALNHTLYNPNEIFYKSKNPKISIVISIYNDEIYIKTGLISIQNQDLKDVEIVMVDDGSKDNSTKLIEQLMIRDPRIVLYKNEDNKGALYTKTKGILNAKGKYVMIFDINNMYTQKDAFRTLYEESEKNNLDILGFASKEGGLNLEKGNLYYYLETPVLFQPNVTKRMYDFDNNGRPIRMEVLIGNYFFRTELFIKIIKQINKGYLNKKIIAFDDTLLFFLLTRAAYNLRQIKRIFNIKFKWDKYYNKKEILRLNRKYIEQDNLKCLAYMSYIEFILKETKNEIKEKRIPSMELKNLFLNNKCRNNPNIRKYGENVCKFFLENNYIEDNIKKEIKNFLH